MSAAPLDAEQRDALMRIEAHRESLAALMHDVERAPYRANRTLLRSARKHTTIALNALRSAVEIARGAE